jgi:LacI family transcriptional regulator
MGVTIRDVAREANVSIGTVSRVVNGNASVHPDIRRQVERAIRHLSYRPHAGARDLRRGRTGTIGVVISDLANPIFTPTVQGIERVAGERGTSLFLCDSAGFANAQTLHLERLHERRVDGVILHPTGAYDAQLAQFVEVGIPVVLIGQRRPTGATAEIVVDEYEASLDAMRLLLRLGHRRICLVLQRFGEAPLLRTSAQNDRVAAYEQAHREAGVAVDDSLIVSGQDAEEARSAVEALLCRSDRPTALTSGAHPYTPDLLAAVRDANLTIPDDLSFISYGDSPWARVHQPPLTVIRTGYPEYGRRAAELLFAVIEGRPIGGPLRQRAELVVRGSCAPPGRPAG